MGVSRFLFFSYPAAVWSVVVRSVEILNISPEMRCMGWASSSQRERERESVWICVTYREQGRETVNWLCFSVRAVCLACLKLHFSWYWQRKKERGWPQCYTAGTQTVQDVCHSWLPAALYPVIYVVPHSSLFLFWHVKATHLLILISLFEVG